MRYHADLVTEGPAQWLSPSLPACIRHHIRWQNFFCSFNCDIIYIEGHKNKVADALSHYYESSSNKDIHYDDLVSADILINKKGEDLPLNHTEEAHNLLQKAGQVISFMPVSTSASDVIEQHHIEAKVIDPPDEHIGRSELSLADLVKVPHTSITDAEILTVIRLAYKSDKSWAEVLKNHEHFLQFVLHDGLILHMNNSGDSVLVIPNVIHKGEGVRGLITQNAHNIIGHFGYNKTITYMHKTYWWSTINKDIEKSCTSCEACQTTKRCTMKQHGLLHQLPIPDHLWSGILMDFISPFPESLGKNYLWVVMCCLTLQVHLVPINTTMKTMELANEFMNHIV